MHSIVFFQLLLNFRRVARITTQLLSLLASGGGDKFRREGSGFIEIEILILLYGFYLTYYLHAD